MKATATSPSAFLKSKLTCTSQFLQVRTNDPVLPAPITRLSKPLPVEAPLRPLMRLLEHLHAIHSIFDDTLKISLLNLQRCRCFQLRFAPAACTLSSTRASLIAKPSQTQTTITPNTAQSTYLGQTQQLKLLYHAERIPTLRHKRAGLHLSASKPPTHRSLLDQNSSREQTEFATTHIFYEQARW